MCSQVIKDKQNIEDPKKPAKKLKHSPDSLLRDVVKAPLTLLSVGSEFCLAREAFSFGRRSGTR